MNDELKILSIGNSFSVDMQEYAWQVAESLGIKNVTLGNLCIGGCTLSRHLGNTKTDSPEYEFRLNTDGQWKSEQRSFKYGMEYTDWQYITMQQASGFSGIPETYKANLNDLIAHVKATALNPEVKLLWHMTWAYQSDSLHPHFVYYGNNRNVMYESIKTCVKAEVLPTGVFSAVIPSGEAVERMRALIGDTLTRDGFHMSIPLGRYLTAMALMRTVTGKSVKGLQYAPEGVTDKEKAIAQKCIEEVCTDEELFSI